MATFYELVEQAARDYAREQGQPVAEIPHGDDYHLALRMKHLGDSDADILRMLRRAILAGG
ncbi:MAG: hypothetical protein IMZ55_06370 [Acidobacteria bacterium]|nr:hypothetical protein [Acidobacteriota bacterium]